MKQVQFKVLEFNWKKITFMKKNYLSNVVYEWPPGLANNVTIAA